MHRAPPGGPRSPRERGSRAAPSPAARRCVHHDGPPSSARTVKALGGPAAERKPEDVGVGADDLRVRLPDDLDRRPVARPRRRPAWRRGPCPRAASVLRESRTHRDACAVRPSPASPRRGRPPWSSRDCSVRDAVACWSRRTPSPSPRRRSLRGSRGAACLGRGRAGGRASWTVAARPSAAGAIGGRAAVVGSAIGHLGPGRPHHRRPRGRAPPSSTRAGALRARRPPRARAAASCEIASMTDSWMK